jgi:hypothetical protein
MEKQKIEDLMKELRQNFADLNLQATRDVMKEECDDLSMHVLLPDHWQKVKWAVDVFRRYGLENTTENALKLTESGFRSLAKHILGEKKHLAKGEQHPSIH